MNKHKALILIHTIAVQVISLFGFAHPMPQIDCSIKAVKQAKINTIPGAGYWMQLVDDDLLTYTRIGGTDSMMYNLTTHQPVPITNFYDAFPIPPGDIYVHPEEGFSFYKIGDGANAQPIFVDNSRFGVYQSLGLLPQTIDKSLRYVRVAAGWAAGIFQDYEISFNSVTGEYKFKILHKSPVTMCKNIETGGLDSEMPVLSRNGLLISTRDQNDQLTKIYKIGEVKEVNNSLTADCELMATIPTSTNKISFSFSNKKAIFVLPDPNSGKGRLIEMNLETGKFITLSTPAEDVMYMTYKYDPTFRNDEYLVYSRRVDQSYDQKSELVQLARSSVVNSDDPDVLAVRAIGHMWGLACQAELDDDYAKAMGSRLDDVNCLALAQSDLIKKLPSEYASLSEDYIKRVCLKDLWPMNASY